MPATWNPADLSGITLSAGNLTATATAQGGVRSIVPVTTGKYYWEITTGSGPGANEGIGVANGSAALGTIGPTPNNAALIYRTGNVWVNNVNTGAAPSWNLTGQVVAIALDVTARLIWFRNVTSASNWNSNVTYDPATGTGGISVSGVTGALFPVFGSNANGDVVTANFGGSAFSGTVPSGFTAGFPTTAQLTQTALEQWVMPNARAQFTQLAAEVWASVPAGTRLALLTQLALEQWAAVPVVAPPGGNSAVTINVG